MCQLIFPKQGSSDTSGQAARFSTINDVKAGAYVLQMTLRGLTWMAEREATTSFVFRFETAGDSVYYIPIRRDVTFPRGQKPSYNSIFESQVYSKVMTLVQIIENKSFHSNYCFRLTSPPLPIIVKWCPLPRWDLTSSHACLATKPLGLCGVF